MHTDWDMVQAVNKAGPQKAAGVVLFTYDVTWIQSDLKWASRWDIYLSMGDSMDSEVSERSGGGLRKTKTSHY